MGQINNTQLAVVLDKLARFATESVGDPEFDDSFTSGMEVASDDVFSGAGALDAYILATDDVDIVADLLPAARILDETHPTPPDAYLLNISSVAAMVRALNTHFRFFDFASLDAYLTDQNDPTPTIRAHGHFRRYLRTISAANSFIPNDLVLATFAETGATTGTFASVTTIDTTKYAGAQLKVKNAGALTTSAVVSVTATKLDGTSQVLTATLSTHTDDFETALSSTVKEFTAVTAISITTGTNADAFEIVAKTDRDISAA